MDSHGSDVVFLGIWDGSYTNNRNGAEILESNNGGATARTRMGFDKNETVGLIGREEDESFVSDPIVSEKNS